MRLLAVLLALSACVPPPVVVAASRSVGSCADAVSSDDPRADLAALAERCAGDMAAVPGESSATQGEDDPSVRLALEVSGARRCFRVLAAADVGVSELDVQILDPSGRALARDARHGRLAVVPEDGLLCLPHDGRYVVEVAVTGGRGAVVARAFSRP